VPEPLAGECIHRGVLLLWCVPSGSRLSSVILSACPEAHASFVRYRSLTLSAVQLFAGAPSVTATDTMELLSGTAKADNPMVAERGEQRLQNAKRSTTKKWDLSSQDDFLAWNAELSRLIKRQLPQDFVKSSRPTEADYAMDSHWAVLPNPCRNAQKNTARVHGTFPTRPTWWY
jgi:hypothetical protein